jgi:hypothetical protein
MKHLTATINHLGFKQYIEVDTSLDNKDGKNVCPNCEREYTNEGEGVICGVCGPDDGVLSRAQLHAEGQL